MEIKAVSDTPRTDAAEKAAEAVMHRYRDSPDHSVDALGVAIVQMTRVLLAASREIERAHVPEVDALDLPGTVKLAIWFHETYEELAPLYGYETRPESRTFDASSPNGKLMLAVCRKLRERYAFSPQKPTEEPHKRGDCAGSCGLCGGAMFWYMNHQCPSSHMNKSP